MSKTVTVTREFDASGNCIKEITTTTETPEPYRVPRPYVGDPLPAPYWSQVQDCGSTYRNGTVYV